MEKGRLFWTRRGPYIARLFRQRCFTVATTTTCARKLACESDPVRVLTQLDPLRLVCNYGSGERHIKRGVLEHV
jgi:hypothetical protein